MPNYLRFPLYIAAKYAQVYAFLKTLDNASEYVCNLIIADMDRDPSARLKAALRADCVRLENK